MCVKVLPELKWLISKLSGPAFETIGFSTKLSGLHLAANGSMNVIAEADYDIENDT